jgi:hypothetical protein
LKRWAKPFAPSGRSAELVPFPYFDGACGAMKSSETRIAGRAGAHPYHFQTKSSFGKSRPRICAAGAFIQWDRIVE